MTKKYTITFGGEPLALTTMEVESLKALPRLFKDPKYIDVKLFEANTEYVLSDSDESISFSHAISRKEGTLEHIETTEETNSRLEKEAVSERFRRIALKEFFKAGDTFCNALIALRTILLSFQKQNQISLSATINVTLNGKISETYSGDTLITKTISLLDNLLKGPYHADLNSEEINIPTDESYSDMINALLGLVQIKVENSDSLPSDSTVHMAYLKNMAELISNKPVIEKFLYALVDAGDFKSVEKILNELFESLTDKDEKEDIKNRIKRTREENEKEMVKTIKSILKDKINDDLSLKNLEELLNILLENLKNEDEEEKERILKLIEDEEKKGEKEIIAKIKSILKDRINNKLSAIFQRPGNLMLPLKEALKEHTKFGTQELDKWGKDSNNYKRYLDQKEILEEIIDYGKSINLQMEKAVQEIINKIPRDAETTVYDPRLFYLVGLPVKNQCSAQMHFIVHGSFTHETKLPDTIKLLPKTDDVQLPKKEEKIQTPFQKDLEDALKKRSNSSIFREKEKSTKQQEISNVLTRQHSGSLFPTKNNTKTLPPTPIKITKEQIKNVQLKSGEQNGNKTYSKLKN